MKKSFLFFLTVLSFNIVNAQNDFNLFNILKGSKLLQECNSNGDSVNSRKLLPGGSKFTIVDQNKDNYIIKFWKWNEKDNKKNENFVYDKSKKENNNRFFLLPKTEIKEYTKPLIRGCSPIYGITVLPFKYRPITKDFTKDITISGLGGGKYNFSENLSISLVVGVGLATVTTDSLSTNGNIKSATDYSAISIPLGVIFEWKKLQIGLYGGMDWVSKNKINWVNNGKLWIGAGVGYSIFSEQKPQNNEGKN